MGLYMKKLVNMSNNTNIYIGKQKLKREKIVKKILRKNQSKYILPKFMNIIKARTYLFTIPRNHGEDKNQKHT